MARVNTNQPPSDLDWENLGTIDKEKKTRILYLYLYDVGVKSRLFNGFWHAYSYFCSLTTE